MPVAPPVMATALGTIASLVNCNPVLFDCKTWPSADACKTVPLVVAASFLKSGDAVMPLQNLVPALTTAVQVTPLLVDVQMLPPLTIAASLVKSWFDAISTQLLD